MDSHAVAHVVGIRCDIGVMNAMVPPSPAVKIDTPHSRVEYNGTDRARAFEKFHGFLDLDSTCVRMG